MLQLLMWGRITVPQRHTLLNALHAFPLTPPCAPPYVKMLPPPRPTPAPHPPSPPRRFALQEAVLALARLCQRFEFSLDRERHPEGKELRLVSAATLQPKGGIWLRVRHA